MLKKNRDDNISAANVELLIFDLDGTISSTTRPIYEAVKRAFTRLGISLRLTAKEMENYFGAPSPQFYIALTPPESTVTWQEIKETIHEEQAETYRRPPLSPFPDESTSRHGSRC